MEAEYEERFGNVNENRITKEEVKKALKNEERESTGMDGIFVEMLQSGDISMLKWLVRVMNVCWMEGRVPQDWQDSCLVPIYKGKGDRAQCNNYRGISLLSVVGKVYGKVLIERVKMLTEEIISEEQGGFRKGRGCVDQVFTLRTLIEKHREKKKDLFVCFMDLEKAYDKVSRSKLWEVLEEYDINGKLLKGIKYFYRNSRACVRVNRNVSDYFNVDVGLRQGCVMSPWLFNVFMDSVIRRMDRVGKGAEVREQGGDNWDVSLLLFADDTVLVSDTGEGLEGLVTDFERICTERGLKINPKKSKVMWLKNERREDIDELMEWPGVQLEGQWLERVHNFRYLGMDIGDEGDMNAEINHRIAEGMKGLGGLKEIWKRGSLTREVKLRMFESICIPAVLYGCETWMVNRMVRRKVCVFEMNGLRAICDLSRRDRVRNVRIREICNWNKSLVTRVEQGVLKWFGHVNRMDDERLARKLFVSEVVGERGRGRPRWRWMDGVGDILRSKGLTVEEGLMMVYDRNDWRRLVYG